MNFRRGQSFCELGSTRAASFSQDLVARTAPRLPTWRRPEPETSSSTRWRWALPRHPAAREKVTAMVSKPEGLVGPRRRRHQRGGGHRPPGLVVGVHVCRGNFKGKYLSEGGYDSVAERLFGSASLRINSPVEYDMLRAGDFAPLRLGAQDQGGGAGADQLGTLATWNCSIRQASGGRSRTVRGRRAAGPEPRAGSSRARWRATP